jgi:hypothetical protein
VGYPPQMGRRLLRSTRGAAVLAAAGLCACAGEDRGPAGALAFPPADAPFDVRDEVVSDLAVSLRDAEFDSASRRLTWQEGEGVAVWVADVDPLTGGISPSDGRGTLVATDVLPQTIVKNGSEWIHTEGGSAVLYTRTEGSTPWVVIAEETSPGTWTSRDLVEGYAAFGSLETDRAPTFIYMDAASTTRWMRLDGSDGAMFLPDPLLYNPWLVPDTDWLVFTGTEAPSAPFQIGRHDTVTKSFEVLTACPHGCVEGSLWWSEELGDWLLSAVAWDGPDSPTTLVVYQLDGAGWSVLREIVPPAHDGLRYVVSPEVFRFGGLAYVSFQLSTANTNGADTPSEIWIAGLEPGNELMRRVSGAEPLARIDPEFIWTDERVWVYYSELVGEQRILHRCQTGLTGARY